MKKVNFYLIVISILNFGNLVSQTVESVKLNLEFDKSELKSLKNQGIIVPDEVIITKEDQSLNVENLIKNKDSKLVVDDIKTINDSLIFEYVIIDTSNSLNKKSSIRLDLENTIDNKMKGVLETDSQEGIRTFEFLIEGYIYCTNHNHYIPLKDAADAQKNKGCKFDL